LIVIGKRLFNYCGNFWVLEENNIIHSHTSISQKKRGLSTNQKLQVNALVMNGVDKPARILYNLSLNSETESLPSINQIKYYLRHAGSRKMPT
jgi:hypothetical protein